MEEMLKRLGMKKVELARSLGMKPGTVYRWTDESCPEHVEAYLRLRASYESAVAQVAGVSGESLSPAGISGDEQEAVQAGSEVSGEGNDGCGR